MREFKFRAWDKRIKKMCHVLTIDFLNEVVATDAGFGAISGDIELMQYTGVVDLNGTEIYEGDILKLVGFVEKEISEVKIVNGCAMLPGLKITGWKLCDLMDKYKDGRHSSRVIGNIYENPELLEEEK